MTFDKTVAQSEVDKYSAMLMSKYQRSGILKSTVESRRIDVFGDETDPSGPKAGNLMLKSRSWSDGQYLRIFPHGRVQDDDMEDAARGIGQAAARRDDQLILDAFAFAGSLSTVGAIGADVTYEMLAQVVRTLAHKDIDPMRNQVCVACPYLWRGKLRIDKKIKLDDCAKDRNASRTIRFRVGNTEFVWLIKFLPDRSAIGGFDPAQGIGYAFTKESVVLSYGVTLVGNIDWVPRCHSFRASGYMERDAVVQQPEGIVKILSQNA